MNKRLFFVFTLLILGAVVLLTNTQAKAEGGTIIVNTNLDVVAADGMCSLREAMDNANDGAATHGDCPAGQPAPTVNVITFNIVGSQRIELNGTALPDITSAIHIKGATSGASVDGTNASRIFMIMAGASLKITDFYLEDGFTSTEGGNIHNSGRLILDQVELNSGFAQQRGGGIANYGELVIRSSILGFNYAAWTGGGLYNVGQATVSNTAIHTNEAGETDGSGIHNEVGSQLTILGSKFHDNHAENPFCSFCFGDGGVGLYNEGQARVVNSAFYNNTGDDDVYGTINNQGELRIHGSSISNNSVDIGAGIYSGGSSVTHITNSTISGNSAFSGGAIYSDGADITLNNVTVTNNSAFSSGTSGIVKDLGGTISMQNSIVAGNTNGDCTGVDPADSLGYNIFGHSTGCPVGNPNDSTVNSADVFVTLLGSLTNNGGGTWTHALLPSSLAIEHGNPAGCTNFNGTILTLDQRGNPRPAPVGTICDTGAYEAD